jgi:hypothetical protein
VFLARLFEDSSTNSRFGVHLIESFSARGPIKVHGFKVQGSPLGELLDMRLSLCSTVVDHVGEGEGAALLHERVCALDSRQDWLEEAAERRSALLLSICLTFLVR